jgi:HlyD family type I secretion membrane fusion protein
VARAKQRIGEAELQILQMRTERLNEVTAELRQTQDALFDLDEQLQAARDVLERHAVRAPRAGIVTHLQYHAPGAVVPPGGTLLDIVPADAQRLIEARIRPDDIDVVRVGMSAQVRLTAYKLRTTPTVTGQLVYLSADAQTEPYTDIAYYLARIELDRDQLARLDGIALYPGMPAEVIIESGERTALEYLLSPITSGLHRAFREQ